MSGFLLYLIALVLSHVIGAFFGSSAGLLFGKSTQYNYTKRLLSGLVFGVSTIIASTDVLKWFHLQVRSAFVIALVGVFVVMPFYNRAKVSAAMEAHRSNQLVYDRLNELSRTRFVQDLTAAVAAVVSGLVVYGNLRLPKLA